MATVAIAQPLNGAVALIPKTSTPSKLELSKPFTPKIRRIITNETDKLIKQRNEINQAFLKETNRSQNDPKPSDWLSRDDILKLSDALSIRETEHIRMRNKLIAKRKQLYRWNPSSERKIDLELLQALQWSFKRNLNTCLSDGERLLPPQEVDGENPNDANKACQNEAGFKIDANLGSAGQNADSDKGGSHNDGRPEGTQMESISNLDGSFDDYAREMSVKKRKLTDDSSDVKVKKERGKQAKKEQRTNIDQTTCLGSPSLSSSGSQNAEAQNTGDIAAIDSMFQSKKKLKVNDNKDHVKMGKSDVSETTNTSSSSDNISLIKTKDSKINATQTKSSIVRTSSIQKESLIEPWYKLHARAMMEPDFNDMVYYRPSRKRKRPQSDVYVRGALPEPREVVRGGWPLPTPPMSSPSLSPSCSSQSETGQVEKSRGKNKVRKRKAHHGDTRKNWHPKPSASGPSAAVPSTFKAARPALKASSNSMSAS
ncbi:hypothetical protein N0V82_004638 [Gnomoniopsis sp. IMI 355080]|nr:hypothetical protein N0V82_004638 [Gnomoniopsis sp. IMI 355080]